MNGKRRRGVQTGAMSALGPVLSQFPFRGENQPCGHVHGHVRGGLCVCARVCMCARVCVSVLTRLAGSVPLTPHLQP